MTVSDVQSGTAPPSGPPVSPIDTASAMNWGPDGIRLDSGTGGRSAVISAGAGRDSGECSTVMAAASQHAMQRLLFFATGIHSFYCYCRCC